MSNDQMKFWVKCPECQKPFGVYPKAVIQYLNRVIQSLGFETPETKPAAPKYPRRRWNAPKQTPEGN